MLMSSDFEDDAGGKNQSPYRRDPTIAVQWKEKA